MATPHSTPRPHLCGDRDRPGVLADRPGAPRRFDEMNTAWDAWGAPGQPPARATVEARLAGDYLVELMVEAAVG